MSINVREWAMQVGDATPSELDHALRTAKSLALDYTIKANDRSIYRNLVKFFTHEIRSNQRN